MNDSGYKGLGFGFRLRFALFTLSLIIIFISFFKKPEVLLFSLIFFFIVLLFNASIVSKKNIISLDKGQIRRSIAIVFTLVYLISLFTSTDENSLINKNFTIIYGTIIAFYFGSRAFERRFKN